MCAASLFPKWRQPQPSKVEMNFKYHVPWPPSLSSAIMDPPSAPESSGWH